MLQKERFLIKKKRFELNSNTYKSYDNSIKKFYNEFNLYKEENFKAINSDMVEDWVENLDYKHSTVNQIIEHNKEFCDYLQKKNLIDFNPFVVINKYSAKDLNVDSKKKIMLSEKEVIKLIESTRIRTNKDRKWAQTNFRDRAILQLIATQGLRKNIIREMKISDIERNDDIIVIEIDASRTKARINHRICFKGTTKKYFNEYLRMRECYGIDSEYIFTTLKNKQLSPNDLDNIFIKAKNKCGFTVNEGEQLSLHNLRHFTATTLVKNNVNEMVIKSIMNWSINTRDMLNRYSNHQEAYDIEKAEVTTFLDLVS